MDSGFAKKQTSPLFLPRLQQLGERLYRKHEPVAAPVFPQREESAMAGIKQTGSPTDRGTDEPQTPQDAGLPHAGGSGKRVDLNKTERRLEGNHGRIARAKRLRREKERIKHKIKKKIRA